VAKTRFHTRTGALDEATQDTTGENPYRSTETVAPKRILVLLRPGLNDPLAPLRSSGYTKPTSARPSRTQADTVHGSRVRVSPNGYVVLDTVTWNPVSVRASARTRRLVSSRRL
jgi:hypothetical protein